MSIFSAVSCQVTTSDFKVCKDNGEQECKLDITNFRETLKEFQITSDAHNAHVVNLKLDGISSEVNDTNDRTFDPKWWAWVAKRGRFFLDMPIDYDMMSFGLLKLRVGEMAVNISSAPVNCEELLGYQCKYQMIHRLLANLSLIHHEGNDEENLLCRSSVTHKSFFMEKLVGLGMECCEILPPGEDENCDPLFSALTKNTSFIRKVIFSLGVILPVFVLHLLIAWPNFKPHELSRYVANYLTNRLSVVGHYRIRGENGEHDKETIYLNEDQLLSRDGAVTLFSFLGKKIPDTRKLRFTAGFCVQYIFTLFWLLYYRNKKDVINKMVMPEMIAFNLRNVPLAWVFSRKDSWPFCVGLLLLLLNLSNIVVISLWWATDIRFVRRKMTQAFAKFGKYQNDNAARRSLEVWARRLAIATMVQLSLGSFIVIYGQFHMVVFAICGVVLNADLVSAWFTGVALVLFYINQSFSRITATYTEIKRLIFNQCLAGTFPIYKASRVDHSLIRVHDLRKKVMRDQRLDRQLWYNVTNVDRLILFHTRNGGLYIHRRLFIEVCQKYCPLGENVRRSMVTLLATTTFTTLVVFTITVFRPDGNDDEYSVIVTSLVTLFAAMIPKITELLFNDQVEALRKEILDYKIEKLISRYRPSVQLAREPPKNLKFKGLGASQRMPSDYHDGLRNNEFQLETVVVQGEGDQKYSGIVDEFATSLSCPSSPSQRDRFMYSAEEQSEEEKSRDGDLSDLITKAVLEDKINSGSLGKYMDIMFADESTDDNDLNKNEVRFKNENKDDDVSLLGTMKTDHDLD